MTIQRHTYQSRALGSVKNKSRSLRATIISGIDSQQLLLAFRKAYIPAKSAGKRQKGLSRSKGVRQLHKHGFSVEMFESGRHTYQQKALESGKKLN